MASTEKPPGMTRAILFTWRNGRPRAVPLSRLSGRLDDLALWLMRIMRLDEPDYYDYHGHRFDWYEWNGLNLYDLHAVSRAVLWISGVLFRVGLGIEGRWQVATDGE